MRRYIKKVLAPVDGSENSKKALELAIVIAKESHARLTVLEVVEEFGPLPGFYGAAPEGVDRVKWLSEQRDPSSPRLEEHQLRLESEEKAAKIITIHKSKGLEFPIVFIVGCETNLLPLTLFDDTDPEEERRLFYVALTRARDALYLSCFERQANAAQPSPFLTEVADGAKDIGQGVQVVRLRLLPARAQSQAERRLSQLLTEARSLLDAGDLTGAAGGALGAVEEYRFSHHSPPYAFSTLQRKVLYSGMVVLASPTWGVRILPLLPLGLSPFDKPI